MEHKIQIAKSRCQECHVPWFPDNRHVEAFTGLVKDCMPDNLTYLEYKHSKQVNNNSIEEDCYICHHDPKVSPYCSRCGSDCTYCKNK